MKEKRNLIICLSGVNLKTITFSKCVNDSNRIIWIDVAKFVAIIAVMTDHSYGMLYWDRKISDFSCFSVGLFILLMGVTSYGSYKRYNGSYLKKTLSGCIKIMRAYLVAAIVYNIVRFKSFDLIAFLNKVVHFDMSGPFYYVLLYIQLLLVVPILYSYIHFSERRKERIVLILLGLIFVTLVSIWTTNYTNILNVYGGGGKLLGGTYLILLYFGMVFGKICDKISISEKVSGLLFVICAILTVIWWTFISYNNFLVDRFLPFGDGKNPPGVCACVYSILMACTIFLLGKCLHNNSKAVKILGFLAFFGRHTLYLFLYHKLFLDYMNAFFRKIVGAGVINIWVMRIVYFTVMIMCPLIVEKFLKWLQSLVLRAYNFSYS